MLGKPRKTKVRGEERWYVDTKDALTGRRRRLFFHTQADAKQKQEELNAQPQAAPLHPLCDPDVPVRVYGEAFLAARKHGWRTGTQRVFADLLRLHVYPFPIGPGARVLGDLRMRDWPRTVVPAIVTGMRDAGYAPATVRLVLVAASGILTKAVGDRLLPYHPVDAAVRHDIRPLLKAPIAPQVKAFTEDEARHFLALAKAQSSLYGLYLTGFLGGLRLGELTGLQLEDDRWMAINGKRVRQLGVERTLGQHASMTHPEPGPTKNGKARDVNIGSELGAVFDAIKAERPKLALRRAWRPVPPWMFTTVNGTPYSQRYVTRDFKRLVGLAGLAARDFVPHSMRHTFASLHILAGKSPKWLQQQMGHASIRITLDTYADWFKLQDHEAADALAAALVGNSAGNADPSAHGNASGITA